MVGGLSRVNSGCDIALHTVRRSMLTAYKCCAINNDLQLPHMQNGLCICNNNHRMKNKVLVIVVTTSVGNVVNKREGRIGRPNINKRNKTKKCTIDMISSVPPNNRKNKKQVTPTPNKNQQIHSSPPGGSLAILQQYRGIPYSSIEKIKAKTQEPKTQ